MENNVRKILQNIAREGIPDLAVDPDSILVDGDRIRNDILTQMVADYRRVKSYSDGKILDIILQLDEDVENGILTGQVLNTIENKPDLVKDYNNGK